MPVRTLELRSSPHQTGLPHNDFRVQLTLSSQDLAKIGFRASEGIQTRKPRPCSFTFSQRYIPLSRQLLHRFSLLILTLWLSGLAPKGDKLDLYVNPVPSILFFCLPVITFSRLIGSFLNPSNWLTELKSLTVPDSRINPTTSVTTYDSSSEEDEPPKIMELRGEKNFGLWECYAIHILKMQGLKGFIRGTETPPIGDTSKDKERLRDFEHRKFRA